MNLNNIMLNMSDIKKIINDDTDRKSSRPNTNRVSNRETKKELPQMFINHKNTNQGVIT